MAGGPGSVSPVTVAAVMAGGPGVIESGDEWVPVITGSRVISASRPGPFVVASDSAAASSGWVSAYRLTLASSIDRALARPWPAIDS